MHVDPELHTDAVMVQRRAFGVTALTECAVTASRWRRLMGETPVTVAFPGGSE